MLISREKTYKIDKETSVDWLYYIKQFVCIFEPEFCENKQHLQQFVKEEFHVFEAIIFEINEICIYYHYLTDDKKCITIDKFEKE